MSLLKEFRPALLFLGKFLGLYFVGNVAYGLYVQSYNQRPDGVTLLVTAQSSDLLNTLGFNTTYVEAPNMPKVALLNAGDVILYVFEGCNGINVMIVFIAFLFAFGGRAKSFFIFLPVGMLLIHLFNLARVALLFYLAQSNSTQFYYYHKYFFTATLYLVVFALWYIWVIRFNDKPSTNVAA